MLSHRQGDANCSIRRGRFPGSSLRTRDPARFSAVIPRQKLDVLRLASLLTSGSPSQFARLAGIGTTVAYLIGDSPLVSGNLPCRVYLIGGPCCAFARSRYLPPLFPTDNIPCTAPGRDCRRRCQRTKHRPIRRCPIRHRRVSHRLIPPASPSIVPRRMFPTLAILSDRIRPATIACRPDTHSGPVDRRENFVILRRLHQDTTRPGGPPPARRARDILRQMAVAGS